MLEIGKLSQNRIASGEEEDGETQNQPQKFSVAAWGGSLENEIEVAAQDRQSREADNGKQNNSRANGPST